MAYRTILTVARIDARSQPHIDAAIDLAARFDAHLDVLCLGIDEVQVGYFFTGADAILMQSTLEQARDHAEKIQKALQSVLEAQSIRWSCRSMVSQVGAVTDVISGQARYSDLVVLPQPYAEGSTVEDEAIVEAALFAAAAPVLIVPPNGLPATFPGKVGVAWNGGDEALRAVRAGMPLLNAASGVEIIVVDPPRRPTDLAQPGVSLSQMLDRHGIDTHLVTLTAKGRPVTDAVMSRVKSEQGGMVIAGAYGHSRFREAILGGATRDMLTKSDLPVLMTH